MPGTSRTSATETASRWDSTRTVARGVSPSVAERRARALGKDNSRRPGQPKEPSEIPANIFGLLWIVAGVLIIGMCMVFVVGSVVMFGVLNEISDARNFDDAVGQAAAYEDFFNDVADKGFKVTGDKPNIQEGVTKYLWTVQPPNDAPLRVFSWQHDLEDNRIRPTSNAAALLDIELGYITPRQAEEFARQSSGGSGQAFHFNPDDAVTNAIIDRNTAAFARNSGTGWGQTTVLADTAPPLPPPLIDPRAKSRKAVGTGGDEEEEVAERDPTEGEVEEEAAAPAPEPEKEAEPQPEPPTEVQPAPPEDGDEGGAEPEPEPEPVPDTDPDDDSGDATPVR